MPQTNQTDNKQLDNKTENHSQETSGLEKNKTVNLTTGKARKAGNRADRKSESK